MARVFISVGSNLGCRLKNIKNAFEFLKTLSLENHLRTSFLYETPPFYCLEQPKFLNAVIEIKTHLLPMNLLSVLKSAETSLGRVENFRYGPRVIDMDILLYDDNIINQDNEMLVVPHPRLHERTFVLKPLCDLIPDGIHPQLNKSYEELLSAFNSEGHYAQVLPLVSNNNSDSENIWMRDKPTRLMGILNVTPDSFSDGGEYNTLEKALERAKELISLGADIIDIGGQSTRPGACEVTVEEELRRVIPVIRKIRESGLQTIISVDTYRSEVAKAAILEGAHMVNDISGGKLDEQMLLVVAGLGVPFVITHSRGSPSDMATRKQYNNVIDDIAKEMAQQVIFALNNGVPRWNIILDPGIGFAKGLKENIAVIKNLKKLFSTDARKCSEQQNKNYLVLKDYPVLVGPSRKQFLESLILKKRNFQSGSFVRTLDDCENTFEKVCEGRLKRDYATAACVTACVEAHASIVRVHHVEAMSDVIAVADAIYK
ncbi:dihydropteroate synthase-like [Zophobas morio]|uniref:dihydropteroate synthase-like n=1 Tax=Zophobas morio TaxID=2755281 RepID=UPI003083E268